MSYFNHAFKKVFLPSSIQTAAGQRGAELTDQELAVMIPSTNLSAATAGLVVGTPYYFAMGPYVGSDTLGNGLTPHGGYKETIKSKIVNPKYVTMLGTSANQAAANEIYKLTAEYNCFPCGSLGMVRIDLKGSPALRFMAHNMYKIFSSNNMCCTTGESYQDPSWVLAIIADLINADDYWKQFISAGVDYSTDTGGSFTSLVPDSSATPVAGAYATVTGTSSGALATITSANQGRLVLTAAFTDTTFGNCSFDPGDFVGNVLPLQIANADVLDETGDVCITCGTGAVTTAGAMAIGSGEEVLRKMILSESYRQHHFNRGARDSIRMREIEQGDDLVSKVTRSSNLYNSFYLQHHVPRFNNPSGTFDNDQYLLEFIGLGTGAGGLGGGVSAALNTLFSALPAWAAAGMLPAPTLQDLQAYDSIT
tara:strand:+ start:2686 stop:3954 length:1269 start_codon:yes stop_codon:yes gene_type:complete